jgi:hypothetical protein
MEIDKSHSKSLSRASTRSSKKKVSDVASDDISMSQLELLANKKKLNKKSEEISLDNIEVVKDDKSNESVASSKSEKKKKSSVKSTSRKSSVDSSSSDSSEVKKQERKRINKENKNESIRKEKSEMLFKLYTIVEKSNGRWSCKMTMDNSLDEIKNEFTRIKSILDNESMVKFCKHGLVMGIKGIEMLNGSYDPIGVDLDGWSESMSYSMATTEYDEVLSELCEKYKGTGSMSPEVKLLLMIIMSGAMFSFSKKAAKDPNTLSNLMGAFMKNSQSKPQSTQPSQPPQPPQPQSSQPSSQQFYRASSPPRQTQQQSQFFEPPRGFVPQTQESPLAAFNRIPSLAELHRQKPQQQQGDVETEDSDNIPSKIRGPSFDSPDSVNIEKIIQTMREKSKQKEVEVKIRPDIEQILNETETSDDIIRNIPAPKARGKGRPRKNAAKAPARNA